MGGKEAWFRNHTGNDSKWLLAISPVLILRICFTPISNVTEAQFPETVGACCDSSNFGTSEFVDHGKDAGLFESAPRGISLLSRLAFKKLQSRLRANRRGG